jgi:hypothetical protein
MRQCVTIFIFTLILITTLTSCNNGYKVDDDKVYYKYWNSGMGFETKTFEIIGADPLTFKVLDEDNYAIDKKQAYYKGEPILNSDPKTFVPILDYYAKDNYHAFMETKTIKKADGRSFTVINGGPYSKDKNDFYFDTIALNVNDLNSFKILNKTDEYGYWAKDKTHYYILSKKYPLADYQTFINIGNGYAKDKFRAYFRNNIILNADISTFKSIQYGYAEDKNSKFDGHEKLNIKDSKSYQIIKNGYTKDKLHVYSDNAIINGADPDTFEIVDWKWEKDKSTYYYQGKAMKSIDYKTFILLENNYSTDKNKVYYYDKEVVGADPSTFTVNDITYIGKDKFNCYQDGEKVECN